MKISHVALAGLMAISFALAAPAQDAGGTPALQPNQKTENRAPDAGGTPALQPNQKTENRAPDAGGTPALQPASQPASRPAVEFDSSEDMMNEILALWAAGEFAEAIETGKAMHRAFPEERRGKGAFYHLGLLTENQRLPEAQTPEEARAMLAEALEFYRQSSRVEDQFPEIAARTTRAIERVGEKIADVDKALDGELDYLHASEKLSDHEAARAAVDYLKRQTAPGSPENHRIYFFMLIHQTDYIDSMNAKLGDAYRLLRETRPELFDRAYERYTGLMEDGIGEAIGMAQRAIASWPDSPHALDYHVYLGDAWRYAALLHVARHDRIDAETAPETSLRQMLGILRYLNLAIAENRTIIQYLNEVEAYLAASGRTPESMGLSEESLRRHRANAEGRIAEFEALIEAYQPSSREP